MASILFLVVMWSLGGFLLGILAYLVAPLLLGPNLPRSWSQRIGDWYRRQAVAALRTPVIVNRETGGVTVRQARHDPKYGGETFTVGGETYVIHDVDNQFRRMGTRPFGVVDEVLNMVVDPMQCRLGEAVDRAAAEGTITHQPDAGGRAWVRDHVGLPRTGHLVDPDDARGLQVGGLDTKDAERAFENARKSQDKFKGGVSTSFLLTVFLLMAGSALVPWFVASYGAGAANAAGGGGGVAVGGFMDAWVEVVRPW